MGPARPLEGTVWCPSLRTPYIFPGPQGRTHHLVKVVFTTAADAFTRTQTCIYFHSAKWQSCPRGPRP